MTTRVSAPAKGINHLPALWANECLPPRMIDTQCGLKTYDGEEAPLGHRSFSETPNLRGLPCDPDGPRAAMGGVHANA